MIYQSAICIVRHDDLYLAIESAKGHGIILPGGKFEENDKLLSRTAIRETEEETGIRITNPKHIFQMGYSLDNKDWLCHTFVAHCYNPHRLIPSKEGIPIWAARWKLMDSIYGFYYELMFHHYDRWRDADR